jgi:hypothetical protein
MTPDLVSSALVVLVFVALTCECAVRAAGYRTRIRVVKDNGVRFLQLEIRRR